MAEQSTDPSDTHLSDITSKMKTVTMDECAAGDCVNTNSSKSQAKTVDEETVADHLDTSSPKSEPNAELDEEESAIEEEDYEIDEVYLKDLEVNTTDDEKENLKTKGLELKAQGNAFFKESNFKEALRVYTEALRTCPLSYSSDRSILYSNRAACFQHLEKKEEVTEDCTKALELNPLYVKARLRRAQNYESLDKLDEALEDYKKILESEPMHREASYAIQELPPRINERNEKLKTEMLGKLKDLGNLVLRPFGLSTENFKMQQDPSTGSYSINFQQQ